MELGDLLVRIISEVPLGDFLHQAEIAAAGRDAGAQQGAELGEVVGGGDGEVGRRPVAALRRAAGEVGAVAGGAGGRGEAAPAASPGPVS